MSIKADRWIRRMAQEHNMIEPFEAGQVRRNSQGEQQIAYGTASYVYVVRGADHFKIFTKINSAVVDPKNFDDNSFVDFHGDVCIIPPNSFALACSCLTCVVGRPRVGVWRSFGCVLCPRNTQMQLGLSHM